MSACGFMDTQGAFRSTMGGYWRVTVDKYCKIRPSTEEACEEFQLFVKHYVSLK